MWVYSLIFFTFILVLMFFIVELILHENKKHNWLNLNQWLLLVLLIPLFFMVASAIHGGASISAIPRQRQIIELKEDNVHHFHTAMKYDKKDERNERRSVTHLHWAQKGNYAETHDNEAWHNNYHHWLNNKAWIQYYRVAIEYEKHPLTHIGDYFYLRNDDPMDYHF